MTERKPILCHFDRREKSVNPVISMVKRFLDTLERTVKDSFVSFRSNTKIELRIFNRETIK